MYLLKEKSKLEAFIDKATFYTAHLLMSSLPAPFDDISKWKVSTLSDLILSSVCSFTILPRYLLHLCKRRPIIEVSLKLLHTLLI